MAWRLHLRPGWKDYSVSIFINPGPFPSACSRPPWETFIYRGLTLAASHFIFIFNCLLQQTHPVCSFNTQCSTLLLLNGRKTYTETLVSALGCWGNILTQCGCSAYIRSMVSMQTALMNLDPLSTANEASIDIPLPSANRGEEMCGVSAMGH